MNDFDLSPFLASVAFNVFFSAKEAQALTEKVHFYDESGVIYSLDRVEFKAEILIPVASESSFYLNYRF